MYEAEQLEKLKTIKRKAKALYNCLHKIYSFKMTSSSVEERMVFSEAISALERMYRMYEMLKTDMRKESFSDQITFASNWNTYLISIEAMTAYKTKDKYLLNGVTMDASLAKQKALEIYRNFNQLVSLRSM